MYTTHALFAIVLLSPIAVGTFAQVTDRHGVRVSQRVDTSIIELVADGDFAASPDAVRDAMLDYEHGASQSKELAESRIVARGDHFLEVYQRLKLPIVADRDYTLRVTWGEEGAARWLRFTAASEHGPPPRKGIVRMSVHEGRWRFEPTTTGGATRAHYELRMDLGGSLPPWMARRRAAENIPEFFEALRRRLQRGP